MCVFVRMSVNVNEGVNEGCDPNYLITKTFDSRIYF